MFSASPQSKKALYGVLAVIVLGFTFRLGMITDDYSKEYAKEYERLKPPPYGFYKAQTEDIFDATPSYYYINTRFKLAQVESKAYADPPFDEDGIPVVDYHYLKWSEIERGRYYNPTIIAQYALSVFEHYLDSDGDAESLGRFTALADWLVSESQGGVWRYAFSIPSKRLHKGWSSAMAQGQGISVLCRAFAVTGKAVYKAAAIDAAEVFFQSIQDGGMAYIDDNGTWLEEYPSDPPPHVLNGEIFALFGLYDLVRITGDLRAETLFSSVVTRLKATLPRYETVDWVRYQLDPSKPANNTYYPLHIAQLEALSAITGEETFSDYAKKWRSVYKFDNAAMNAALRALKHIYWRVFAET